MVGSIAKAKTGKRGASPEKVDPILAGAQEIAASLIVPGGQASLDFVIEKHLAWFDTAQARGMQWRHIAGVLAKAGACRENGQPFTIGHLSAVVWRQRQKAARAGSRSRQQKETPVKRAKTAKPGGTPPAAPEPERPRRKDAAKPKGKETQTSAIRVAPEAGPQDHRLARRPHDRDDVRAFMQRAAELRRRPDDD
ncbi:hypothetical protein [Blastochloris sulfoviridis]|uniref:Uncharacterized protein n=1 Tax=Blastochloris sulfoviridis TaxID=50712 RepID=A0A5M6HHR5_9HYPH|nr:hypothetical protein [Blastochloris sulfoviridis]KAA5595401.1 hypothetical protein F1193_16660 [Blastochloris sulfoviridis]